MEKEIYLSRFIPSRDGVSMEIEKCIVNNIEIAREYVQKLGWKLISQNEPVDNVEHLEIYDRIRQNEKTKPGFLERYIRY